MTIDLRTVAVALMERGAMACMLEARWTPQQTFAAFLRRPELVSRDIFGETPARILGRELTTDEWDVVVTEARAYASARSS